MPYLVRANLFIGDISDAAEVLQNNNSSSSPQIAYVLESDIADMPYSGRENLFIGNISADNNDSNESSSRPQITHVLSVLSSASISFFTEWRPSISIPVKEIRKVYVGDADSGERSSLGKDKLLYGLEYAGKDLRIVRMAVPLRDMESENLLDYLDVCFEFIEDRRKQGAVLVHCFAGVSRSAAIITAYLMKSEGLSQEAALESLRQSCEFVSPNDGFLEQLKMFEEMGFKVDRSSYIYKRFRLRVLGDSYNRGEKLDSSQLGADPASPERVTPDSEVSLEGDNNPTPAFRCKKCRRVVALQENVIDHVPGEGETSFGWNKRRSGNPFDKHDEFECSSIFIEPLSWMTAVKEGALEGKLSCAKCDARLGYFNWSGIQCSCGSWITPAFQLHKSKVDISAI
ncbi:hypothetical protein Drorol1_Dr00002130 [Drosera rotundifolia]